jgi:hypothetical protein
VAGIPTARFRQRLSQMAANQGLSVIAVDAAYTSRWGLEHTLCVNPLPKKTSIMGVVHNCGGCDFPQSPDPAEALLGGLTGDPERISQLSPGVPGTAGGGHDAGEMLLGSLELRNRCLDGF